jgi:predicted amidohydrolase
MTRLAVAQTRCVPGDLAANLAHGAELIAEASRQGAQLVCLPECFDATGSGPRLMEIAEPVPKMGTGTPVSSCLENGACPHFRGKSSEALSQAAADGALWVIAGVVERAAEQLFNTALVISPSGDLIAKYRKCYLYMSEADTYAPGRESCLVDFGFAQAGVVICYDYIFPEYIRSLAVRGAQLIVHPTMWWDTAECRRWGYPALEAYRAQCRVRALENGVFFLSANHACPTDRAAPRGPVGHSCIVAPWGEMLVELGEEPGVAVAEVDFAAAAGWAAAAAPYLRDYLAVPPPAA